MAPLLAPGPQPPRTASTSCWTASPSACSCGPPGKRPSPTQPRKHTAVRLIALRGLVVKPTQWLLTRRARACCKRLATSIAETRRWHSLWLPDSSPHPLNRRWCSVRRTMALCQQLRLRHQHWQQARHWSSGEPQHQYTQHEDTGAGHVSGCTGYLCCGDGTQGACARFTAWQNPQMGFCYHIWDFVWLQVGCCAHVQRVPGA